MKKIIILLVAVFFMGNSIAFAQGFFMLSTQCSIVTLTEDTMTVRIDTWFSIGYEETCPELSDYTVERKDDSLILQLYYDVSGVWPMVGCEQIDTLDIALDKTISNVSILSNSINYNRDTADHNGQDTVLISDTTLFNPTGISVVNTLNRYIKIAPNPVADYLHLEARQGVAVKSLALTDIQGRVLKSYQQWKGDKIDVRNLAPGIYFLKVQATDGRQGVFKVLKL